MAGSSSATLVLKVVTDASDAARGLDQTSDSVGKFKSGMQKAGVAAGVAGGAILAFGVSAANAAAEDARGQAILAQALKNNAGATQDAIAQTEGWIDAQSRATGVADDQLRPALATLARATGDVGKSQDALKVAMDVSAATGDDVTSVADAMAKAYAGNTTSLGKMVPGMDKAVLAGGDMTAIMAELAKMTGGSAAAAADTAAGKQEILKNSMDETKEAIGAKLLPAFSTLLGMLQTVVDFIASNSTVFLVLAGVVGVIAAAILALNLAMTIHTAVVYAMNAAWLASPITWIILGIVALIAVIVIIATKTTWFQDLWNAAWGVIKGAAEAVWDWIRNNWPLLLAILTGPIGLAVLFIVNHLDDITGAAQGVWNFLSGAFTTVWNTIKDAAVSALDIIMTPINAIKDGIGWIIDKVKTVTDLISKIPKIPGLGSVTGSIPGLNAAPALAAAPSVARAGPAGFSTRTVASGGGITVNVNVSPLANPAETGRAVVGAIRSFVAAGGRMPVNP